MRREPDKLDPEIISRMKVDWSYKPIEELDKHYSEEYLLPIIRQYDWIISYHLVMQITIPI